MFVSIKLFLHFCLLKVTFSLNMGLSTFKNLLIIK